MIGIDDGIWYPPGYFPADDAPTRVVGGAFDGDRRVWPRDRAPIRDPVVPVDCGILDPDQPAGVQPYGVETYGLYRCIHAPGPGEEGPTGIEWLWMTQRAFLWMTEGRHRPT